MFTSTFRFLTIVLLFSIFTSDVLSQKDSSDFYEENITFPSNDIILSGTLTIPNDDNPHPALILIPGGGNRNRDAQVDNFKPFKLIAEYLSCRGFVVLRFDDRGVGESSGKNSLECTLDDFKDDALAAVKYLKAQNNINISEIGLLGHCAAVYATLKAASESENISFIISMAGCGFTGEETIIYETREVLENQGRDESEILELQSLRRILFQVMRADTGRANIEDQIKQFVQKRFDSLSIDEKSKYNDFTHYFSDCYDAAYIEYGKNIYIKDFMVANPIPLYEKYTKPILLLFGEKDKSVSAKYHEKPIVDALTKAGNINYQVSIIPDADHYFVEDWDSNNFAPKFLPNLYEWLAKNIQ